MVTSSTQVALQSSLCGWVSILEFIYVPADTKWLGLPVAEPVWIPLSLRQNFTKAPTLLPQIWITCLFMVVLPYPLQASSRIAFLAHFH